VAREQNADGPAPIIEALPEAEQDWLRDCDRAAEGSLFKETASWIFGQNVPGKKYALRFYFGGLKAFYESVQRVIDGGYAGFKPLTVGKEDQIDQPAGTVATEEAGITAHL